ncbi:Glycosyltransferase involved in cell wall bisynthesis [Pseudobutyrivibrio sp. C4]|uniref:glycosyltransferase family 2 protein n=1 Tax=Pseudobutyrivibrio sp. C4 TaxID=1520803 RepID=UPI0008C09B95|nr:glycosyltransferase family 2 protein [Pseudobutyrivibrio sp. C4]SET12562.1 Glycosyltransferase involved in cell wall bisynthesis [Pseudobutyrivibrio sp. C4]
MDVSVIIPMYNVETKIERAISSVLKQTIIDSVEIICVDDGSTDNTIKKVKEKNVDNIHVYNQHHLGPGIARNLGISKATGRYIAFLDADDEFVDSNALEKMVYAAEEHNIPICGSLRKVVENGEEKEVDLFSDFEIGKEGLEISYSEFQKDYDYQSYIYRKSLIDEYDISFPVYERYEDPVFFVKAMAAAKEFYVVPVYLYKYYYESNKQDIISNCIEDILKGMRDCAQIALDFNYKNLLYIIEDQTKNQYWNNITQNMTTSRMALLMDINDIYRKEFQSDLSVMKEILDVYSNYVVTKDQLRKVGISNDLMRRLVLINLKQRSWNIYFEKKSLNKVVIHGLGTYGEILVDLLNQNNVNIVYAIDRNKTELGNIVINQEYKDVDCDAVIVSLAEPEEIIRGYREIGIKALAFKDMINELSEGLI